MTTSKPRAKPRKRAPYVVQTLQQLRQMKRAASMSSPWRIGPMVHSPNAAAQFAKRRKQPE